MLKINYYRLEFGKVDSQDLVLIRNRKSDNG